MPPWGVLASYRPPMPRAAMPGSMRGSIPVLGSGIPPPTPGTVQCMAPWVQQWLGIGAMPAMDGSIIVPLPAARFIRSMLEPPMGGIIPGCITPVWVMPLQRFEIKHLQ